MTKDLDELIIGAATPRDPSPDLWERVVRSIADDRRRRRRIAIGGVIVALVAVGLTALVVQQVRAHQRDEATLPWWSLELATNLVLVGLAVWLGPFIKRFGKAYAADVFRSTPQTGKSYLVLTDIVYYLIFAAYILFTVTISAPEAWVDPFRAGFVGSYISAAQIESELTRIGGILLVIGVLHGLNILLLPVLGRLFRPHDEH